MSGTASVQNTFQSAVTATGLQLDQNYNTIVAYLNDPTNRNNYAADGGTTNTVVTTFAPPVVGGYTAGLELTWKWAATNAGATVLNANGVGNINVVNPDGSALQSGQGTAGSIGKAVYDGTRAIFISPPSPATQAQMQTATGSASFVTPALVRQHPGVAKASGWLDGTATGTITQGALGNFYGVARAEKIGAGVYAFVFSTGFANTQYAFIATACRPGGANVFVQEIPGTRSTISCQITTITDAGAAADATYINFSVDGTL